MILKLKNGNERWDIKKLRTFFKEATGEYEFSFNDQHIVIFHQGNDYYIVYTDKDKFYIDNFNELCSLKIIDNKSINELNYIDFLE